MYQIYEWQLDYSKQLIQDSTEYFVFSYIFVVETLNNDDTCMYLNHIPKF